MPNEACFHCKQSGKKISAYITKSLMPVCIDCLNILIDKYWWDENSVDIKKARGLSPFSTRSKDELVEELNRCLSHLPFFNEKKVVLDRTVASKLMRMPELRRIPPLREF